MALSSTIRSQLSAMLASDTHDEHKLLNNGLRLLAKWRSVLIQNTFIQNEGTNVIQGPLKGLRFLERSSEGCHVAKLIGCYEQPLQRYIEKAIADSYELVLNIGCAEGYYAVGLARSMRNTKSLAFDIDDRAQESCALLAQKNAVSDRVEVKGEFKISDFSKYNDKKTLVFCDIEGAEEELLNPRLQPALRYMDLIVESHECLRKGVTKQLISRFENTHEIIQINDNGWRELTGMPSWFKELSHLDQLLATWEWRSGPTPWLIMYAKESVR